MDDRLVAVVVRLLGVRQALGEPTFHDAVGRALQAIAVTVHAEAERRAHRKRRVRPHAIVVPFPLARTRPNQERPPDPRVGH